MKSRGIVRIVPSLALIGAGFYLFYTTIDAALSSGREVARLELSGGGTRETTVRLEEYMNPLRAVFDIDYEMTHRRPNTPLFDTRVEVRNTADIAVWSGKAVHRDDATDRSDHYHKGSLRRGLGTFDVSIGGGYRLDWSLNARTATVSAASLSLRANAAPVDWLRAALGGGIMLAGIAVLFARRRGARPPSGGAGTVARQ